MESRSRLKKLNRYFQSVLPALSWIAILFCSCIAEAQDSYDAPRKLASNFLPNPIEVRPGIISGGLPESQEAFEELKKLGVRTIISVDGARPDVAMAQRYSMRYVHIPHGYDGIPEATIVAIAKAIDELPGPLYIHCHHGKHRSPAATAAACVALGKLQVEEALEVMQLAGTSRAYKGLYLTVQNTSPIERERLSKLQIEFPSVCDVPPLVDAMVALEETFSKLQNVASNRWKDSSDSGKIDPSHEAVLLREHFEEMRRLEDVAEFPEPFHLMLKESELAAVFIESMLNPTTAENSTISDDGTKDRTVLSKLKPIHRKALEVNWATIRANCSACHQQFRD